MVVRAKICGIRSEDDLGTVVDAGADAVGFIVGTTHYTEDALSMACARELCTLTPPLVSRVLVTHLTLSADILRLAELIGVDTVQIHGLVSAATVREVFADAAGLRVVKAVHVTGLDAFDDAIRFSEMSHSILLDSRTERRLGGTGVVHDWTISAQIVDELRRRGRSAILAGGLTPANVASAIETVGPYAVDANSGLEDTGGNKDPGLCQAFVSLARSRFVADAQLHSHR